MTEFEIKQRIRELEVWFETYFEKQLIQSTWQKNFSISKDPYFKTESGEFKTYSTIEELKEQAELVRQEIKELRNYKEV